MKFEIDKPVSVSKYLRTDRKLMVGAQWLTTHTGPGSTNNVETCALLRTEPGVPHPDILVQFLAAVMDHDDGLSHDLHGFSYAIGPVRVEATGWVKLNADNPAGEPRIRSNFLTTDYDLNQMRHALRIGRELASQKAHDYLGVKEAAPGKDVNSPAEIDEYLRNNTDGDFHLCGTCKMGNDSMAVVDPQLRLHGIEGLRVVDASVMPSIVSANTNATTIMIGEKAADMIHGKPPLPKADVSLPAA